MVAPETPLDDAAQSPLRAGDILAGKYRVERQIGRGGMGIVLAATHLQLEHLVAIKVLRRDVVEDDKALTRLLAEARAAAKIRSEHVARVLDVGTLENGSPFIVMEYLEGEDLADLLDRQGALDVTMAVQFLLQSCEALAEVHAAEMVHRDLKPGNLFVAKLPDGSLSLKIVDFGISKHIGGSARHHASTTTTSTVLGSPYYMPPEQMRAEPVDERSDIWSLGAILFEMLTGRPPFLGDTLPEVYAAVLSGTVPSVSSLRPDIPQGLDDIVQRCLDKDPGQRFCDVADLAEALGPFGGVTSAQSVERVTRILSNPELFRGRTSATPRAGAVEPVAFAGSALPAGVTAPGGAVAPGGAAPGGAAPAGSAAPGGVPVTGIPTARGGMSMKPPPLAPSPVLEIGPGSALPQPATVLNPSLLAPSLMTPPSMTPSLMTASLVTPALASFGRRTGSNSPVELSLSATGATPFSEIEIPQKKRGLRAAWGAVAFAAVVVVGALWMRVTPTEAGPAGAPSGVVAAPYGAAPEERSRVSSAPVPPPARAAAEAKGSAAAPEPKPAAGRPPVVTVEALQPAPASPRPSRVEPERVSEKKPGGKTPVAASPARPVAPRASAARSVTKSTPPSAARPPASQNGSGSSGSKQKANDDDPWNPSSFGDRR
jgi:serine/threonine-protein kinase